MGQDTKSIQDMMIEWLENRHQIIHAIKGGDHDGYMWTGSIIYGDGSHDRQVTAMRDSITVHRVTPANCHTPEPVVSTTVYYSDPDFYDKIERALDEHRRGGQVIPT